VSETKEVGHVEIEDAGAAQKAIDHLNRTELETLAIYVEESKPVDLLW